MNLNPKDAVKSIKSLLGMEVALEVMDLDNGTKIEAEAFEAGYEVFIVNQGERVALPVGEYTLADGKILVVSEEGIIAAIKEAAPAEEAPEAEAAPAQPELEAETPAVKKVVETVSKEVFFAEMEKLRNEFTEKLNAITEKTAKEETVEVEAKEELSAEVKPEVHNPETKIEREVNLYSQKRARTTKEIVFNKLFSN